MSRPKKQLEFEDIRPIQLNLIHGQYCSRRHKRPAQLEKEYNDTYLELRQIQTDNGIVEEFVEVDYPITPDYVKSFASSTDYRNNDIETAMNSPARGTNLGDMTGIQDIISMDMASVKALQEKLMQSAKDLNAVLHAENVVKNTEVKDKNTEVKDNAE